MLPVTPSDVEGPVCKFVWELPWLKTVVEPFKYGIAVDPVGLVAIRVVVVCDESFPVVTEGPSVVIVDPVSTYWFVVITEEPAVFGLVVVTEEPDATGVVVVFEELDTTF